jgi:uncharacterized protein (DUF983 family)
MARAAPARRMSRHHRCPNCQAHVGWGRLFLARPIAVWPCTACGFPLRWVDPPRRTKLFLGVAFGVAVIVTLSVLSVTGIAGHWRLLCAAALAFGLGASFQLALARVGPAGVMRG